MPLGETRDQRQGLFWELVPHLWCRSLWVWIWVDSGRELDTAKSPLVASWSQPSQPVLPRPGSHWGPVSTGRCLCPSKSWFLALTDTAAKQLREEAGGGGCSLVPGRGPRSGQSSRASASASRRRPPGASGLPADSTPRPTAARVAAGGAGGPGPTRPAAPVAVAPHPLPGEGGERAGPSPCRSPPAVQPPCGSEGPPWAASGTSGGSCPPTGRV